MKQVDNKQVIAYYEKTYVGPYKHFDDKETLSLFKDCNCGENKRMLKARLDRIKELEEKIKVMNEARVHENTALDVEMDGLRKALEEKQKEIYSLQEDVRRMTTEVLQESG